MDPSIIAEANRHLAQMEIVPAHVKANPSEEMAGRYIINRPGYRSRSQTVDSKSANKKHISIADELDRMSEDETLGSDPNSPDADVETLCEKQEPLEEVDLGVGERGGKSNIGGSNAVSSPTEPPTWSKSAFEDKNPGKDEDTPKPPTTLETKSTPVHHPQSPTPSSPMNKIPILLQPPTPTRLETWLSGFPSTSPPPSSLPSSDPCAQSHAITLATIAEYDKERSPSPTELQSCSSSASVHTRLVSFDCGSRDDVWDTNINIDVGIDLPSLTSLVTTPDSGCRELRAPMNEEVDAFVASSIRKIGVLRVNKRDRRAAKKMHEIRLLVEKVLREEVGVDACGERRSLGDLLDESAWRV